MSPTAKRQNSTGRSPSASASASTPASASRPAAPVNTGNPRITVAFPFSRISIGGDAAALAALADLVRRLAEAASELADQVGPDLAGAMHALAHEAAALSEDLVAG